MWGFSVHQKCSTTLMEGSFDPRPSSARWSSPMVTTVESRRGVDRLGPGDAGPFSFAGKVNAGDIGAPGDGSTSSAVAAPEQGLPRIVQEPRIVGNGCKAVLGEEQGMIAAEAEAFGLDEALIVRVVLGYGLPVELEVALYAVGALEFEVGLLDLFKQGVVLPGGAVVDGGDVGRSAHRHEVAIELIGGDVLGLVDFEEGIGGVAYDVAGRVGAEEKLAGVADAQATAIFDEVVVGEAGLVEDLAEASEADMGLGVEGGGGFNGGAAFGGAAQEGGSLDVGGQLVLAALTGDHDGEGEALTVAYAIEDGAEDLVLVGPEGVEGYQGVTPAMPKTNWSMAAIMTKKKSVLMRPLISETCRWSSARRISRTASKVDSGLMAGGAGVVGLRLKMFMGFLSIGLSRDEVHAELQGDVFDDGGDIFGGIFGGVAGDAVLGGVGAHDELDGLEYAGCVVAVLIREFLMQEVLEAHPEDADLRVGVLDLLSADKFLPCSRGEYGKVEGDTRGGGLLGAVVPGLLRLGPRVGLGGTGLVAHTAILSACSAIQFFSAIRRVGAGSLGMITVLIICVKG